jgi:hypothetical protein
MKFKQQKEFLLDENNRNYKIYLKLKFWDLLK